MKAGPAGLSVSQAPREIVEQGGSKREGGGVGVPEKMQDAQLRLDLRSTTNNEYANVSMSHAIFGMCLY